MDAESRAKKAHELYQEGKWAEAVAELTAALNAEPHRASWHFNLGLTFEASGDYIQAHKSFTQAAELDENDIETLNHLGMNLTRLGKYSESLDCFKRIEKIDPSYEQCYCNRIVTFSEIGRHDEAEIMFYTARLFVDECPACYFNLAESLLARGKVDRAIFCLNESLRIEPNKLDANARLAQAYRLKGQVIKAREHYQAELDLDNTRVQTLLDYADFLVEIKDLDAAEKYLKIAIDQSPPNPGANLELGKLALGRGDARSAEICFIQALSLDPQTKGANAGLARALIRQNKIDEASKHIVEELRRSPRDPKILKDLGAMLVEAHLNKHAVRVLTDLVELTPGDADAHNKLGVSLLLTGKYDEGIAECNEAIRIHPEFPLACYNLALAYYHKGDIPQAQQYVDRVMTMDSKDEQVLQLAKKLGSKGGGFWHWVNERLHGKQ